MTPRKTLVTFLAAVVCASIFSFVAQEVEGYSRYRRSRAEQYSRVMSRGNPMRSVYSATRGHHGTLSESNVHSFRREFASGQSMTALYSALGQPNNSRRDRDEWMIQRIGIDGRPTGQYGRFVAEYRDDGKSNTWAEW